MHEIYETGIKCSDDSLVVHVSLHNVQVDHSQRHLGRRKLLVDSLVVLKKASKDLDTETRVLAADGRADGVHGELCNALRQYSQYNHSIYRASRENIQHR